MMEPFEKSYRNLRKAIKDFELAIDAQGNIKNDREDKLADKSLVILKVGAKLLKRILRERGVKGRLKDWPKDP